MIPSVDEARISADAARAHEQKNCLSIILAVASLVTPELSDGNRARMERLRAAAHRIRDLIDPDLAGHPFDHVVTEIDVHDLFESVCEMLRDRAEAAQVALLVDCSGGCVRAVASELREALFNLIANALEATPAGKAVVIHTDTTPEGDQLWSIHDAGVGMPPEVVSQLGIPHRSFRPGGSGLGIALARAIIRRHGGSLRFDSVLGRGTTVSILLPRG